MGISAADLGGGAEGELDVDFFAVAEDAEGDLVAGLVLFDDAGEVHDHEFGDGAFRELLAVNGEHDVLGLQSGLIGHFVGNDRTDGDGGGLLDFFEGFDIFLQAGHFIDGQPGALGFKGLGGDVFEDGRRFHPGGGRCCFVPHR